MVFFFPVINSSIIDFFKLQTTIVEKMIAVYHGFEEQVRSYIAKVESDLVELAEQRLREFALAIAKRFRSLVEYAKPMEYWRGLMRTLDALDHRGEGSSPRKSRRKKGRGKEDSGSEEEEVEDVVDDEPEMDDC